MPIEVVTIPVPHDSISRQRVFEYLDLSRSLMNNTDEATWLSHLRQLNELTQDTQYTVRRGGFQFQGYPQVEVNGVYVHIEQITAEKATELIGVASNNKVELVLLDGDTSGRNRGPKYSLVPLSELEKAAYTLYMGESVIAGRREDGVNYISIVTLKVHMRNYYNYITSGDRKLYLKRAIRTRMQDSITAKAPVRKEWDTAQITKFEKFLRGVKSKLQPENNPFNKLPMLPHQTLSSRTWGIEIEAPHIDGIETPEFWELKGDGSLRSLRRTNMISRSADPTYCNPPKIALPADQIAPPEPARLMVDHRGNCSMWNIYSDPCNCGYQAEYDVWRAWSIEDARRNAQYSYDTLTGEWNSPVLRSFHSRGLKHLTAELEPRRVNDSAGIHVHVGAKDLSPDQVVRLGIIYTAFEPLFESEYKRGTTRRFCESINTGEMISRFNQAKEQKQNPTSLMYSGTKYWTVNVNTLRNYGTIEFRAMGPIYNYDHLVKWAYFVREIVNIAKADVPQSAWSKVRTIEDLVVLFSKYGKETPTPEWAGAESADDEVAKIISGLGKENRRHPHKQPLVAGSQLNLVNDDYSLTKTFMIGEREPAGLSRW